MSSRCGVNGTSDVYGYDDLTVSTNCVPSQTPTMTALVYLYAVFSKPNSSTARHIFLLTSTRMETPISSCRTDVQPYFLLKSRQPCGSLHYHTGPS